tara:strand:+ start:392 stop:910 length:519 start_codon:yes stop_codon:yes gene_type:complete
MMEDQFTLMDLDRRISNLIQLGKVVEADYPNAKLRVEIGDITTEWLPWLARRASFDNTWWSPEIGEQVIVLAPSGEINQAVILPSVYQQAHSAPADSPEVHKTVYKDGTVIQYDRENHVLTANVNSAGRIELIIGASTITMVDAQIEIKNGGSSIVVTASGIKLAGDRIDLN